MTARLVALALTFVTAAAADPKKEVVFGVSPGPYGDMVRKIIKPGLEQKGWTVSVKEFSDYVQPNLALSNGSIQANLFQHRAYLEKFSKDKGLALAPVITVPTAGLGLYSHRIKSLNDLKAGDEVTLANDPTNLARALKLLQRTGLVELRGDVDPTKASEKDIAKNPRGLKFRPIEAAQLPRSLDGVALAAVNGNYAIAAHIPLSSALAMEQLEEQHKNLIAVREQDVNGPLAQDLKAFVQSPQFRAAIDDPSGVWKDFQKPDWMK
ncbi:MAG TPA: MetQ/NlpA family ABC transporter substrate-binding protein [Myxococcales bacterium]|nr:MetQ/NlpA family ABC transporter substrate-binding protein [Myxococcales bacterium]